MLCMYARPTCQLFGKILFNAQAICFASNLYIYTVHFLTSLSSIQVFHSERVVEISSKHFKQLFDCYEMLKLLSLCHIFNILSFNIWLYNKPGSSI